MSKKNLKVKSLIMIALMLFVSAILAFVSQKIYYQKAYPTHYSDIVQGASKEYSVEQSLVYAVIRTESGFMNGAESSVGARGLMQITEDTFNWAQYRKNISDNVHYDRLFEPELNIDFGVFILSILIDEFSSEETALAAYHAGWGNVKQWLQNEEYSDDGKNLKYIPFDDTRAYVSKVMQTKQIYKNLYDI